MTIISHSYQSHTRTPGSLYLCQYFLFPVFVLIISNLVYVSDISLWFWFASLVISSVSHFLQRHIGSWCMHLERCLLNCLCLYVCFADDPYARDLLFHWPQPKPIWNQTMNCCIVGVLYLSQIMALNQRGFPSVFFCSIGHLCGLLLLWPVAIFLMFICPFLYCCLVLGP